MPCTPTATPAADAQAPSHPLQGRGRGCRRGRPAEGGLRPAEAPPPEPRAGGGGCCVPVHRRQGDDDVTQAAEFGMFGRRRPLLGNAKQASGQGPAPRSRLRTPVRAVLAGPGSEPPAAIPEGCRVPVLAQVAAPPGTDVPTGGLLLFSYSLSLPVSSLPISPHLHHHHSASGHHPSPLSRTTTIASQEVFLPLPCLSLQSVIHLAAKALIKTLPDRVTPV